MQDGGAKSSIEKLKKSTKKHKKSHSGGLPLFGMPLLSESKSGGAKSSTKVPKKKSTIKKSKSHGTSGGSSHGMTVSSSHSGGGFISAVQSFFMDKKNFSALKGKVNDDLKTFSATLNKAFSNNLIRAGDKMVMDEYFETIKRKGHNGRYFGFMIRVNGKLYEYFLKYDLNNNQFEIMSEKIHHKFDMPISTTAGKAESLIQLLTGTYRPSLYYKWVDTPAGSTNRFITPEVFKWIIKLFDTQDYGFIRFNDKNKDITDVFKKLSSIEILEDFNKDAQKREIVEKYLALNKMASKKI